MDTQRKFNTVVRRLAAAAAVLAISMAGSALAQQKLTLTAGSPGGGYFQPAAAFAG